MTAYRSRVGRSPNGLWPITFNAKEGYLDKEVTLPCGKCIGCRLERSRQWAIRCVHEASCYEDNCFLTLTYADEHLQKRCPNGSLNKVDFVNFMKYLRRDHGAGIRFFHCGEYGENFERPHHHACIFNFDFTDKKLWSVRDNVKLYRSEKLEKLWPWGHSTVGEVTFESAAYVARYVVKKITGEKALDHYKGRIPEYITMSRRPGIGRTWWDTYKSDVLVLDRVVARKDLQVRPPKYYDTLFHQEDPKRLEKIKRNRQKQINLEENTPARLAVKEKIKTIQSLKLKRGVEHGNSLNLSSARQQGRCLP